MASASDRIRNHGQNRIGRRAIVGAGKGAKTALAIQSLNVSYDANGNITIARQRSTAEFNQRHRSGARTPAFSAPASDTLL
jgi:hypothetical protein